MRIEVEERLAELGVELPEPSAPGANYVPFVQTGKLVFVTGQLSQWNGERRFIGKLGREFGVEEGQHAARLCALNVMAQLRAALDGNLDRVVKCVRIAGYVNSMPEFHGQSQVINGASDMFIEVFGERGRHARMAVGVARCRTTWRWRSKGCSRFAEEPGRVEVEPGARFRGKRGVSLRVSPSGCLPPGVSLRVSPSGCLPFSPRETTPFEGSVHREGAVGAIREEEPGLESPVPTVMAEL